MMGMMMRVVATVAGLAGGAASLQGQSIETAGSPATGGGRATPPSLEASRLTGPAPTIDGLLDEPDWAGAMAARSFVVFEPNEGMPASQATEARVLYGADAVYVGIRAFDTSPDSIVARLARRDERPHSDWLDVVIDSYHDRRTAFRFGVNPAGVKSDGYLFDDVEEDDTWDAVWDVATSTDDRGWTAEFRIPYSQLRFDGAAVQTWGINFARFIARHLERSLWAPISRGDGALVSRFGELSGLRDLSPPARLEILPYSLSRLRRAPGSTGDPFHSPNDLSAAAGADLKYGITTDLTLDVTINPDFGQVEADPAQVNLTAFETFFPERRPFFVEGSNIFSFRFSEGDGDMASEGLFYSRRIGRPPQGRTPGSLHSDSPDQTRILGAMKLSGKTRSGWTLGLLHALTGREEAQLADAAGSLGEQVVEPFAQYGMGRVSRDFREGRSAVGLISTWTARDPAAAETLALHSEAYTAGIDARHRFGDDRFVASGYLLGSTVRGSTAAITRTQRSPARYFQRPDADHTDFDPARTALDGWAGSASFSKISGGYWRYGTGVMARSPGFDSNDLGFMREADFVASWAWAGYNHYQPSGHFQRWNLNVNAWAPYSFGGEPFQKGGNVNGSFTLNNFWGGFAGVMRNTGGFSNTALRGGPMLRRDPSWGGWFGFWSDSRKPLQIETGNNWQATPENDSWSYGADASLRWRPLVAGHRLGRPVHELETGKPAVGRPLRPGVARLPLRAPGTDDRGDHGPGRLDLLPNPVPAAVCPALRVRRCLQRFQAGRRPSCPGVRRPVHRSAVPGRRRRQPPCRHQRRRRPRVIPQPGLQRQAVQVQPGSPLGVPARVHVLRSVVTGARPLRAARGLLLRERPGDSAAAARRRCLHGQAELLDRMTAPEQRMRPATRTPLSRAPPPARPR